MIVEVESDLFMARGPLGLCVSHDFYFNHGIAKQFKQKFGHQAQLRAQSWRVGEAARAFHKNKPIFYLVTKDKYWHRSSVTAMYASLKDLAEWCSLMKLPFISLPCVDLEMDGLKWPLVRSLIEQTFNESDTEVHIYHKFPLD